MPKTCLLVSVFRLSLSSNLPPAFSSLINLFYFIQLRGKINYYFFISPIFNNLLTCLSIVFYDHLVIALPKGFVFVLFLFTAFYFITVPVGLLSFLSRLAAVCTYQKKNVVNIFLLLYWTYRHYLIIYAPVLANFPILLPLNCVILCVCLSALADLILLSLITFS